MDTLLGDYNETKECTYKGEHYLVRDNGAVYRLPKEFSRRRKLDNQWSFGTKNLKTGYMTLGGHRVHIIVATAFHGVRNTMEYVVDHIDTNRCNNRPENLRWLTKLENALSNPATRKKIEYLCGGNIQRFIDDPSCLKDLTGTNQDVMWMRTVSKEEARATYKRIMEWAKRPSSLQSETPQEKGKMGEWIYKPEVGLANDIAMEVKGTERIHSSPNYVPIENDNLSDSLTSIAKQRNWTTPTEFPLCPLENSEQPLVAYLNSLKKGAIVSKNVFATYYVDDFTLYGNKLIVRSHTYENIKNFAVMYVTYEDGKYVHEGTTFFEEQGAMKKFTLAQGLEWKGEEGIDDYC